MITLLLKHWRAVGLVLIIGLSLGYGKYYNVAYKSEKAAYSAFKADIAVLAAKQEAKNAFELTLREQITTNVVTEYANSINKLKDYYAKHPNSKLATICLHSTNYSSPMPTPNEGASGAGEAVNGTSSVATINLEIAGEEVLQCQALIQWNVKQDNLK